MIRFLNSPSDFHSALKQGFAKLCGVWFVCIVAWLICVLMTSCHALIIADHLTYSGSLAKKNPQITVTDSTKIITTQSTGE